ncbi:MULTISPECIES: M81 family metallopeptidase [unclassified Chelatococcus]|uniref:M81 family metallopeptidase n=1 Tax=unclassified Chelatococcus TaxID=2638111 RepID=UPI001BCFC72D|nr:MULTISPECIES: M81 family metallopeptidase [unclassified Chelatococcus]MBS7699849.1 M81 family metallopeptidase [Chelatococcus sp. YT9]MBX3558805.1 M81 family metallopeptidase [Chelatococcus sp.]
MRIFVSSLFHEGNSFSRLTTRADNFATVRGSRLLEKAAGSSSALGGACRVLADLGCEILSGVSAVAPPGGPVDDRLFSQLRGEMVAAVETTRPDGVYLDLHGAMITESLDDPEGALITAIREAAGPQTVIAVSLDLHAHVTKAMLADTDVVLACKENPHTDYHLAGERAATLLVETVQRRITPVTAAIWLPLIFGAQMETARGPLSSLHARRSEILAQHPSLLDISICNCTTLVNVPGGAQCITAIANDDPASAKDAVEDLARMLWDLRDAFTPDFTPLETALADVASGRLSTPVILGDQGDRVLAGAAGDGTVIMSEIARHWPDLNAVVPITDPDAVLRAQRSGVGGVFEAAIGGGLSKGVAPFHAEWSVLGLGNGHFVHDGPYLKNEPATLGDTAVLRWSNLTVLVTSLPGFTQDPAAFRSQGIELDDQDVIVAKSGYHFKISFGPIGSCVVVDTPGISNYRPGLLPFTKRRPVYPEDMIPDPDFIAEIFTRIRPSTAA